jgi:hypothetical protein
MLTQQEIIAAFEGMNGLLVSANIGKLLDEGVLYKTVVSKKIFIPQTTIKRSQK